MGTDLAEELRESDIISKKSAAIGAYIGYFVLQPLGFVTSYWLVEPNASGGTISPGIYYTEVLRSLSLETLLPGILFTIMGAAIGLLYARAILQPHMLVENKTVMLNESLDRFRAIAETCTDAGIGILILQDTKEMGGALRFANSYCAALTGYHEDELFDMSFYDLILQEEAQKVEEFCSLEKVQVIPGQFETEFVKKDGTRIPVALSTGATTHEYRPARVVFCMDITRQKRTEESMRRSFEELKSLDDLKSNIIANVSHELRTPLTIALSSLELAMTGDIGENRVDFMKKAYDALIRQNFIIGNLLEAANLDNEIRSMTFKTVDVSLLIENLKWEMESLTAETGQVVEVDIVENLHVVEADYKAIQMVLRNILSNAIKFTEPGGRITMGAKKAGDMVEVWVEDTGIGIPEDQVGKVFDRFYQVDSTMERRYGGTGLGLALVREIIEAHRGEIGVESQVGKGSRFFFTLPHAKD